MVIHGYVNSIAMCETLYIWFHSELKDHAYAGEVTIENRMIEMYHAHTDEETKHRIMSKFSSEDSDKGFNFNCCLWNGC